MDAASRTRARGAGAKTAAHERIEALGREVRELRQAEEIPREAWAYFAMAAFDRGAKP
jgi:transposase